MPWCQIGVTHYIAKLGHLNKGRAVNYYVVWLGSMKGMYLRAGLIPCCGQDGYQGQVPQHPAHTNITAIKCYV